MPAWIQQDPVGIFTVAISFGADGKPRIHKGMLADLTSFAAKWARNIKAQKFAERGKFTSLTHKAEAAPDAHLELMHEDRVSGDDVPEPYEPSPYDGTYSEG